MSVFFVNQCKFNGCGQTFKTLQELIYHIEDTHLDFEPKNIDENEFKQTSCMPVSYIFRLFSGDYTNRSPVKPTNFNVTLNNSRKDSGSELDEENYESESEKSSIDSWSNNSIESDSNTVLKIINATKPVQNNRQDDSEKPYICQFNNCKKRYRNSNGLKYHTKSVHTENGIKKEPAPPRMYRCVCNKNYKTIYGLKNHAKTCNTNLAQSNPIGKLTESSAIKATVISSPSNNSSLNGNSNITTKPIVSVSIATTDILPPSPPKSNETTNDISDNQMQEDDQLEDNLTNSTNKTCLISIKAPTLQQHLLSPIRLKQKAHLLVNLELFKKKVKVDF